MIYTASYFNTSTHHGKLISVSRSNPKEFARIPKLGFFAPSKDLLDWWKKSAQTESDWQNYQDRFFDETIDANFDAIAQWINQPHRYDITLLCWEKPRAWCHRNDVGDLIANRLPHLWGGFDVPLTPVEQMVLDCRNKGLEVRCDRLNFIEEDFSLYHVKLGKKDLGQWTDTGIQHILSQLLNPTQPIRWLKELGIDLEVIGHPSLKRKEEPKRSPVMTCDKRESVNPVTASTSTQTPSTNKKTEKPQPEAQSVNTGVQQLSLF